MRSKRLIEVRVGLEHTPHRREAISKAVAPQRQQCYVPCAFDARAASLSLAPSGPTSLRKTPFSQRRLRPFATNLPTPPTSSRCSGLLGTASEAGAMHPGPSPTLARYAALTDGGGEAQ